MPELDPIKVKVQIEYDGSGIEQAKKDLESLAETGGNVGESMGGASDGLAAFEEQAGKSALASKNFNDLLANLPQIVSPIEDAFTETTDALDEHTQAMEEAAGAHEDFQNVVAGTGDALQKNVPAMRDFWQSTQDMQKQMITAAENASVFQDALVNPDPFELVQGYLNDTGQTWSSFASSIGDENATILKSNQAFREGAVSFADANNRVFTEAAGSADEFTRTFQKAVGGMPTSFFEQASEGANGFAAQLGNVNKVAADTNSTLVGWDHSLDEAGQTALRSANGINEFGGAIGINEYGGGLSDWLSGEASSIFGGGGIMGILNDVAMPLMAVQMIGMGVQQLGQSIYDAAAIAEGPAAHGVGSFTGAVDVLNQSVQKSGQSFAENFGQGVLPTLDAINNSTAQNGGGFNLWGWLGQGFGMEASLGAGVVDILGGNWSGAGAHGLANYYANFTGQPEPYPGPAPQSQAQVYYQQQMQNLPNTIQMSAAQLQAQGTVTLAEALDPNWEAAYNQQSADQRASQYLIGQYQSRHYISTQQAIENAQYDAYAAQQEQLYAQYGPQEGGGGFMGGWTGFAGGSGGWSGPTYGDAIGKWLGNTFGGMGAAGMANLGSLGNLFSNIFGGIGNIFSGGGTPQPTTYSGGCFVAGTKILLANGDEKPIETLQTGEEVQTHEGAQTITNCMTYPAKQTYELVFSDGTTLLTTDSHPISTIGGWESISPSSTKRENPDLSVTRLGIWDIVHTINGDRELLSIQKRAIVQVFNITVANTHTYYANGVLVHNKFAGDVGQQTADQIAGITLPHIDLSGISSQLAGAFGGITLPPMPDLSGSISGALSGMFGSITVPTPPDIGGMINGAMSSMFGGISMPQIPDIGSMLNGALSSMFGGISLPTIPDVGSMVSGAMSSMFGGISLPSVPDVGSMINGAMSSMFGGISVPSIPNIAGSINSMLSSALSGISIPFFASGVENFGGGLAVVGDAGPELVSLPAGSSVYPMSTGAGVGGGTSPISFGGGGGSMPQSLNLTLQIGNILTSQMIPLAQDMRLVAGIRGY